MVIHLSPPPYAGRESPIRQAPAGCRSVLQRTRGRARRRITRPQRVEHIQSQPRPLPRVPPRTPTRGARSTCAPRQPGAARPRLDGTRSSTPSPRRARFPCGWAVGADSREHGVDVHDRVRCHAAGGAGETRSDAAVIQKSTCFIATYPSAPKCTRYIRPFGYHNRAKELLQADLQRRSKDVCFFYSFNFEVLQNG